MNPNATSNPSGNQASGGYTVQSFAKAIQQKYPNGVASDGTPYAKMNPEQLTQKIVAKYPVYKNQISDYKAPAQPNALGDFATGVGSAILSPLQRLGATAETGLDQTLGRAINLATGKGNVPTTSGQEAFKTADQIDAATPQSTAGKAGNIVGMIAPYFTGVGEEEAGAKLASMVPQLAEKLGMSTDTLIPKVISYLAKVAPNVAKNTAIGTAQTGSLKQGAEVGIGGQLLGDTLAPAVGKTVGTAGKVGSQILGFETGSGASSVQQAFKAGQEGSSAFTDTLRGNTTPGDVLKSAENAVQNIVDNRRTQYLSNLKNVQQDITSKDITPVLDTLKTQLDNFGIKIGQDGQLDFSRSSISPGSDASKIQQAYDTVTSWGQQTGDRTAVGLDTLKQRLGNLFNARIDGTPVSAFLTPLKQSVRGVLSKVPGYDKMTADYSKVSNLLDEIKSATGIGGTSKPDTIMTKLQTAMSGDNQFRLQVMQNMMNASGVNDLEQKLAGLKMSSYTPKSLVGKGEDAAVLLGGTLGHIFSPATIPLVLSTSPRVVGEFVRGLGVASRYTAPLVNLLSKISSNPDLMSGINAYISKSTSQVSSSENPATPQQP